MNIPGKLFRSFFITSLVLILVFVILSIPKIAESEGRQINSGPYSLTVRGGWNSDSAALGLDARANFLDPVLNFHLFGTYDVLDASNGIGEVDNQRFGAGFAFSKTYPDKANVFAGTALIKELDEYFGHAYVGGKLKVSDYALLTGSYGFGLGPKYDIMKKSFLTARASNWGKLGGVLVRSDGLKANFNYYLTDPGGENISGLDGKLSYPVTDSVTVGIRATVDLTENTAIDKNWQSFAFLTYSFGSQSGSPIAVALDINSPVAYPKIIRDTFVSPGGATSVTPLTISPTTASVEEGSGDTVTFTASGGVAPYVFMEQDRGRHPWADQHDTGRMD